MAAPTMLHGVDQSGPTKARPENAPDGFCFYDTELNVPLFRDNAGHLWRDALGRDVTDGLLSLAGPGAPANGPEGTGAGLAAPGCLYQDTAGGALYCNSGDRESPYWAEAPHWIWAEAPHWTSVPAADSPEPSDAEPSPAEPPEADAPEGAPPEALEADAPEAPKPAGAAGDDAAGNAA